jgi:hypothetical protein
MEKYSRDSSTASPALLGDTALELLVQPLDRVGGAC